MPDRFLTSLAVRAGFAARSESQGFAALRRFPRDEPHGARPMKPPSPPELHRLGDKVPVEAAFALGGLFDEIPDAQAWVKDARRRYLWANRAFLRNYAMASLDEVVGRRDEELSPAHLAAQFREGDESVLAGLAVRNRLERIGRYDHTATWCLTTKLPVRDRRGRALGTVGITRPLEPAEIERRGDLRLGAVIALMTRQLHGTVENRRLARAAGMSVRAFERAFAAEYGMSPQRYLRRLRLQAASRRLVSTREGLAEIAAGCGFADQSHFTREFRRLTGTTPGRYRERYRDA